MKDENVIEVVNLGKTFFLPQDKATSVKGKLINIFRRNNRYKVQHALQDISFEVKKGEFFGIVGRNGGGKSTLLKIISGIYTPTSGAVRVNGRLTPFIELGVGFNPELTGRENVFLNGALLGFSRREMQAMYQDIIEFAELERFMDQKLKNYSSGMQVRLAFSIAIRSQSDILIMDEVLAVGDASFQKKCFDVFRKLKKEGRTIVLVTHDMGNVEKFCDRVLVIHKGKQLATTNASEATSTYAQLNVDQKDLGREDDLMRQAHARRGSGEVMVKKVTMLQKSKETKIFEVGKDFTLRLELDKKKEHKNTKVIYGLSFHNPDDLIVAGPNSIGQKLSPSTPSVTFTLPKLNLAPGDYRLTVALYNEDMDVLDLMEKWLHFSVVSDHTVHGLIDISGIWKNG